MTLEELQALPVGATVAYRKKKWTLTAWRKVDNFLEPTFTNEEGENFHEGVYVNHLMKSLDT